MSEEEAVEQALRHARDMIKEGLANNMPSDDVDRAYRKLIRQHGTTPFKIRDFVLNPDASTVIEMLGLEVERAYELQAIVRGYVENGQYINFFNCIKLIENIRELFWVIHSAASYKLKNELTKELSTAYESADRNGPHVIVLGGARRHTPLTQDEQEQNALKQQIMLESSDLTFETSHDAALFALMLHLNKLTEC